MSLSNILDTKMEGVSRLSPSHGGDILENFGILNPGFW